MRDLEFWINVFPPGHGRSLLGLPTSKHNPAADLVLKAEEEEERKKETKKIK